MLAEHPGTPRPAAGLVLTRQNLPVLPRTDHPVAATDEDGQSVSDLPAEPAANGPSYAPAAGAARGGYVLIDGTDDATGDHDNPDGVLPDVLLTATGSEVQIGLDARQLLFAEGRCARVVSMPCREWFAGQPLDYQDRVLPSAVRARVSVEAAISQGWRDIVVGDAGRIVSLEHYGASADYQRLYQEFRITADAVAQAARDSLRDAASPARPGRQQATSAPPPAGPATSPPEPPRHLHPNRESSPPKGAIMNEPRQDGTTPGAAKDDVDIDLHSSATAPSQDRPDEPALTTSKDAQRDDLTVQPDNS